MTNGDMLVTGAGGAKGIIIMATDYSNGNDQIVAKPGRIVKGFLCEAHAQRQSAALARARCTAPASATRSNGFLTGAVSPPD
jgi:hypothetical protein